jgi:activator of 2-hydroxyglutaryl-CoA dehydratase
MTGGVAKNVGVVAAFERLLGTKLLIPDDPQLIGAVGAAALALETYQKSRNEGQTNKPYNRRRYY